MENKNQFVDLSQVNGSTNNQPKGSFDIFNDVEPKLYDKQTARRDIIAARSHAIASRVKMFYVRFSLVFKLIEPVIKLMVYSYVIYQMFS